MPTNILRFAPRTRLFLAFLALLFAISVILQQVYFTAKVQAVSTTIVISQVYGGGGNSGATYKNDFIELFNRGAAPASLTGWSVQYAAATGTSWQKTDLTAVTLQPGQYYLIQEAQGAGGTINLPTPDAIGTIAMSATAGKVALVNNNTLITAGTSCPTGATIVDFVGYGTTANCFEGAGAAPAPSNPTADLRALGGCTDTDVNSGDFSAGAPNPRNTAAPLNVCGGEPTPTPTPSPSPSPSPGTCTVTQTIAQIQGNGNTSPFAGNSVVTSGVVTGRKSNGFYIQMPSPGDSDPTTSDGVFVFSSSAPPAAAAIGNTVCVGGTVQEFIPSADPNSPPTTEISGSLTVTLLTTGDPLPSPVTITTANMNVNDINNIERLEGMRVHVDSLTAVAPTQGTLSEPNATSTSNGVFYGVITGTPRPFREPGVQVPDPLPPGSPCCVPRFDANPERLRIDSDAQPGTTPIDVTSGALVTNITGPLDYAFRTYTILPDAATPPTASGNISATPVPTPGSNQFTMASFNMQRFYDTSDDPATSDVVLTATAFNNRLNKASLAIRNIMRTPDIIGVEEMENLSTLQSVANKVNSDAVTAGDPNPNYQAYLVEGNDIGGIDVGFLVKTPKVTVIDVTQEGKTTTYIDPGTGNPALLNDRPPLVLRATIAQTVGPAFPVTVIVNHLRSLSGIDDPADGNRVRTKRRAQAEFLAQLIQTRQTNDPSEHIVSLGDYNAFEFNDGYVDMIGTIKGVPTPANQVVLASGDLVNPDLTDLVELVPANNRYSYSFDGDAQELDHILITGNMSARFDALNYARNDADMPEVFRNDPNRPERISDHDIPVAYFNFPTEPVITASGSSLRNESCPPFNSAVDPGERVTLGFQLTNNGNASTSNLVATLQTSGGVIAPSGPQSYGAIAPSASATRDFSFTASGTCGGTLTATLQLQDGSTNLGTVSYTFSLGVDSGGGFVCTVPCGGVRLLVTSTVNRTDSSNVQATVTVQNIGSDPANTTLLTTAKLGSTNGTPLPQSLGNIAAGESATTQVNFTNSTPGASSTLVVGGTYTGGTFSSTKRLTIP